LSDSRPGEGQEESSLWTRCVHTLLTARMSCTLLSDQVVNCGGNRCHGLARSGAAEHYEDG
jgi:hypothetical protein